MTRSQSQSTQQLRTSISTAFENITNSPNIDKSTMRTGASSGCSDSVDITIGTLQEEGDESDSDVYLPKNKGNADIFMVHILIV